MSLARVAILKSGWPAEIGPVEGRAGAIALRPLRRTDGTAWRAIRIRDEQQLSPWDASSPVSWVERHSRPMWSAHRASLNQAARRGEAAPFAVTVNGEFAGQVTLGGIQRGALQSAWVGYWIDSRLHGQGVATLGVALATEHAFGAMGLHRLEATISPANEPSKAVVGHLSFRQEGYLQQYLDVGGAWSDHLLFAVTAAEWQGRLGSILSKEVSRRG
jgi:[ribosomal protein S5]-alanine N-acetyltransferase